MSEPKSFPLLHGLHRVAGACLRGAGYRWELRRNGDLRLGLWRKAGIRKSRKGLSGSFKERKDSFPKRLVIVPGFGDTPLSWVPIVALTIPLIRKEFDEVVLLDFPGFGGFLAREKFFHSMDLLLAAVHDVFDSLKPHTLIGHSLGGWLTSHYAAICAIGDRPRNNRKIYSGPEQILLANPSGLFEDQEARRKAEDMFARFTQEGFHVLRPHLFAKEPLWFRWILPEFSGFAFKKEIELFVKSIRDEHLVIDLLPRIKSRVWLIWGEKDTLFPATDVKIWLRALQSTHELPRALLLRETGHTPHVESPAATAAAIAEFLSDCIPERLGRRWWQTVFPPEKQGS